MAMLNDRQCRLLAPLATGRLFFFASGGSRSEGRRSERGGGADLRTRAVTECR